MDCWEIFTLENVPALAIVLLAATSFYLSMTISNMKDSFKDYVKKTDIKHREYDLQIGMLNQRLKVQREDSMAAAIKDATENPEKYLVQHQGINNLEFGTQGIEL